MTKQVVKWFKRFSFWNKIRLFLIPISMGGALTIYLEDANKGFYLTPLVAYAIIHIIETFIKDEDGDGEIDQL